MVGGDLVRQADGSWLVHGRRLTFPVPIASAAAVWAVFAVPTASVDVAVRVHGPGPVPAGSAADGLGPYRPLSILGRTPVVLALASYRDDPRNVLGSYREVIVATPVRRRAEERTERGLDLHVLAMPVTATFTRDAGSALWGFPKWVAAITGELHDGGAQARVLAGDLLETAFEIRLGPAVPVRRLRATTTAVQRRAGELVRVPVRAVDASGIRIAAGGRAQVTLGSGPLADVLRMLEVPGRRPLATFSARQVSAALHDAGPA